MSSLIVHTKNYPHRAVIDGEKASHLKAGLYTGIRVQQHDVHTNEVIAEFDADLQYAIKSMEAGFGTMEGTFLIRLRPITVQTTPAPVVPQVTTPLTTQTQAPVFSAHTFGFREQREKLGLTQKQVIRRTGLSPYEISRLENDKLNLKGLHENTWEKLNLGYGKEFVQSVRDQLRDLPEA